MMKKFLFYSLLCLIVALLIIKPFEANIFNFRFVDEEINFITGKWVLGGIKLYSKHFFNHQPIPSLLSAGIQSFTEPNTIFLLVKRHREFIFFFSIITWWLLSIRFGWKAWMAGLTVLLTKHVLLGWLFLSESLVVPFVLYIVFLLLDLTIGKSIWKIDYWLLPFSLLFIQLNLLPLTPFVIFSIIYFIYFTGRKRIINEAIIPGLIITCLFFLWMLTVMSIRGYIDYTILTNLREMIPTEAKYSFVEAVKLVFLKVIEIWVTPNNNFYLFLKTVDGLLILTWLFIGTFKKWRLLFVELAIGILLNLRPLPIGTGYGGFHLLPWFSGYIALLFFNLNILLKKKSIFKPTLAFSLIIIGLAVYVGYNEYSSSPNQFERWYINYSPAYDYGEAVKLLSASGDTLFASPDASLVYWHSGLVPNANFFFVFSFMQESKKIGNQIINSWLQHPPTFAYIEDREFYKELLGEEYFLLTKRGGETNLYVRRDKLSFINEKQWVAIKELGIDGMLE